MANNEWGTPPRFLESARKVMGSIDLDPTSNERAQKNVMASTFYTEKENGLNYDWKGNVWLNPPYGTGLAKPFMNKVIKGYSAGYIQLAIVLTNNVTDTARFANTLGVHADAFCFPSPRIQFETPPNTVRSSNSKGQLFSYLGNDYEKFLDEFSKYGLVALPDR